MCGVDPKAVKRKVLARDAGELDEERAARSSLGPQLGGWSKARRPPVEHQGDADGR